MSTRLNLVTGAFGFSGSHVVKQLLARGEPVVATDREATLADPAARERLRQIGLDLDHPRLELVAADLTRPESLGPLLARPVTHLFHTASLFDYAAPRERLERVNVAGTEHLLAAIARAAPPLRRLVHWSTLGVFGKPYPPSAGARANQPFSEASPSPRSEPFGAAGPRGTHLVNVYSETKWRQEQLMWRAHREAGLPLTVVRPAPLYGPGGTYGQGSVILAVHRGWLKAVPAEARFLVNATVHVTDMARFADFVSRRDDADGEDFNVVDDSVISQHEFLSYIALLVGRPLPTLPLYGLGRIAPVAERAARAWRWLEARTGLPRPRAFDPQATAYLGASYWFTNEKTKAWGFTYRYPDVREGLRETIAWLHRHGHLR